jgi:hypothetical protein
MLRVPGILSLRRNWVPQPPPPPQRVCLILTSVLGGATLACGGGGGGTQFRRRYRHSGTYTRIPLHSGETYRFIPLSTNPFPLWELLIIFN